MDASYRGWRVSRFWLQSLLCLALAACSVDNRPSFGLLLQVDTDLATPKDLDRVHVEVQQSGITLLDEFFAIGSDDEPPPIEISFTYRGDSTPATFKVVGYRSGEARVERLAITSIPSSRWAVLRMRLQYLCLGQAAAAGGEGCEASHTCVQGECQPATLAESELPDFQMPGTAGSATSTGGVAACFEVLRCFDNASEAQLEPDCSFAINPELGSEQLNVALRLPRGGVGTCGASGCYVPFDQDSEGYGFEPGRVHVPATVCERLQAASAQLLGVVFSNACDAKRAGVAVCYESGDASENNISTGASDVTGFVPDPSVGPACDGGRIKSCGMCGTQQRACDDGTWTDFGECQSEGECAVGETRPCGSDGLQTCGGDCRWGQCLGQKCVGAATRACERCGTQIRACDNGMYTQWGECSEQRACTPGETRACGSGGTQACGGNCEWGECGDQACPGAPSEACGMCGSRSRECDRASGEWSEFGECTGEGVCTPNEMRPCGRGGTQVCGGNCQWSSVCTGQTCEGERSMACGNCGTRTRTCDMTTGTWSDWSPCTGEGECAPDETRGCGRGGTQVCDGSCRWDDACTGQSCLGANRQSCGNCGVQTRRCDGSTGQWSDWSECTDQGECRANSVRSCGSAGTQECGEDCLWEPTCGGQTCQGQGETSRPCGNCGIQRRTCDPSTGRLSAWGVCENEGVCAPESTRSCGSSGTQTCGDNCQWRSACTGQVCAEPPSRACGNCGTQTSTCDPNTGRANWSTCRDEGQCAPGETQPCGSGGEQVCGANCRWAEACTMQVCPSPRPDPISCGTCGRREPRCNSDTGEWYFPMTCMDEGVCTPGESRRCGRENLGMQRCGEGCTWGDCSYECTDPLMIPCGNCGTRRGTCDRSTGRVSYEETCRNQGECLRGSMERCETEAGSGMRVCTEQCEWPSECMITARVCPGRAGDSCGNCGVLGECEPSSGRRACDEPEGACRPGLDMACETEEGTGMRVCGEDCRYSECMITARVCPGRAGDSCGNCGVLGECDPSSGRRACDEPEGACRPGSDMACETSEGTGMRVCGEDCRYSECMITARVCPGRAGDSCGNCGVLGECDPSSGRRACDEPEGACRPGSDMACETSEGTGTRVCGDDCRYSECMITARVCPGRAGDSCGNCGVLGECDPSSGRRACDEPEDACRPGSDMPCETSEGTGTRVCGDDCRYSECTITMRVCPGREGDRCGTSGCGRLSACDPRTGEQRCEEPEDACSPGSEVSCETSEGTGLRRCRADCTLESECRITARSCMGSEGDACGRCGRAGACNPVTGDRACDEPPNACEPGDGQSCTISSYDGGAIEGVRRCSTSCEWGDCEPT